VTAVLCGLILVGCGRPRAPVEQEPAAKPVAAVMPATASGAGNADASADGWDVDLLRRPAFTTAGDTAEAAEAAGLRDECFSLAEGIATAVPRDPAGWSLLGTVHRHFGDAEGAARLWEHSVALDGRFSEAIRQLGDAALEQGNPAEAERRYRQTLGIDPTALPVVGQLAEALLQQGEFSAAAELLEVFLAAHPQSVPGWCALGKTRASQQDAAAARKAYARALELDADSRDAHQGLGRALLALGDQRGAKVHLETVARLQGEKVDRYRSGNAQDSDAAAPGQWAATTHHDAALILARRGDLPAAAEAAQRAIELDAESGLSRSLLAAILTRDRRPAEALVVQREWCTHAPSSPEAWIGLGQMALVQGRGDEAESALRKGIGLAPDNATGLALLARAVAPRDAGEGLSLARRAVDAEPSPHNLYVLADMLVRSGARDEALATLEKAMTLAPGDRRYRQTYEQLKSQP
jgi:tetratricopeptide (TPR) repeat protein